MGMIHGGIPRTLALRLRDACQISAFLETGTFKGETALWAAAHFKDVFSVEIDPDMHAAASQRVSELRNVHCFLGDSREKLVEILGMLSDQPTLIWLDAHVCGQEDRDSPLLQEVESINRLAPGAVILIDDARFILRPEDGRRLCSLDGLVNALNCQHLGRELIVLEDVVIAVPRAAFPVVELYCKEVTLAAWNSRQAILKWKRTWRGRISHKIHRVFSAPFSC